LPRIGPSGVKQRRISMPRASVVANCLSPPYSAKASSTRVGPAIFCLGLRTFPPMNSKILFGISKPQLVFAARWRRLVATNKAAGTEHRPAAACARGGETMTAEIDQPRKVQLTFEATTGAADEREPRQ